MVNVIRAAALSLLLLPGLAHAAAATWAAASSPAVCSLNGTYSASNCRSRVATCASGTCDAPTLATEGISLDQVRSVDVIVCAAEGQTITGGSSVALYVYDAAVGLMAKAATLTVPTGARCAHAQGDSPGKGIPIIGWRGRLVAVPSGITVSAGGTTVYVLATGPQGQDL